MTIFHRLFIVVAAAVMVCVQGAVASEYVAVVRTNSVDTRADKNAVESEVLFFSALTGAMVGRVPTLEVPYCVPSEGGRFIVASVDGNPHQRPAPSTTFHEFDPAQRKIVKTLKYPKMMSARHAPSMPTYGYRLIAYSSGILWVEVDLGASGQPNRRIEGLDWKTGRMIGFYSIPDAYQHHTALLSLTDGCAVIHYPHMSIHQTRPGEAAAGPDIGGQIVFIDANAKAVKSDFGKQADNLLWPAVAVAGRQIFGVTRKGDFVSISQNGDRQIQISINEKALNQAASGLRMPKTMGVLSKPLDNGGQIVLGVFEKGEINNMMLLTPDGRVTAEFQLAKPLSHLFIHDNTLFGLSLDQKSILVMNRTFQLLKEVPLDWPQVTDWLGTR